MVNYMVTQISRTGPSAVGACRDRTIRSSTETALSLTESMGLSDLKDTTFCTIRLKLTQT